MSLFSVGGGVYVEMGGGSLVGVSATIAMLWVEKGSVIVSDTLKNRGAEKTEPVLLAVEQG